MGDVVSLFRSKEEASVKPQVSGVKPKWCSEWRLPLSGKEARSCFNEIPKQGVRYSESVSGAMLSLAVHFSPKELAFEGIEAFNVYRIDEGVTYQSGFECVSAQFKENGDALVPLPVLAALFAKHLHLFVAANLLPMVFMHKPVKVSETDALFGLMLRKQPGHAYPVLFYVPMLPGASMPVHGCHYLVSAKKE